MCRRCKSICRFDVLTESGAEPEKYTRATCAGCASLFFKSRCATFGVLGRVCGKAFSGVFIYVVYKGAFSKKKSAQTRQTILLYLAVSKLLLTFAADSENGRSEPRDKPNY